MQGQHQGARSGVQRLNHVCSFCLNDTWVAGWLHTSEQSCFRGYPCCCSAARREGRYWGEKPGEYKQQQILWRTQHICCPWNAEPFPNLLALDVKRSITDDCLRNDEWRTPWFQHTVLVCFIQVPNLTYYSMEGCMYGFAHCCDFRPHWNHWNASPLTLEITWVVGWGFTCSDVGSSIARNAKVASTLKQVIKSTNAATRNVTCKWQAQ